MLPARSRGDAPQSTPQRWSDHPVAMVGLVVILGLTALALAWQGGPGDDLVAPRIASGLIGSLLIGLVGRRRGWLTPSGHLGAVLVGTLTLGGGGLAWGGLVIVFFVLSSLLSRRRRRQPPVPPLPSASAHTEPTSSKPFTLPQTKGSRRDLGQVLANGGLPAALAVAAAIWPTAGLYLAFVGALAAVTADTWSTEIGRLSRQPPRLITTGRVVPAGTNGGITLLGSLASAAGGLTIGVAAALLSGLTAGWGEVTVAADNRLWLPWVGLIAGTIGGLADSLLGATLQGRRRCPACHMVSEALVHDCGASTEPDGGWAWLDNDRVNLLAALTGALIGHLAR